MIGANLLGMAVGVPVPGVVAELEIDAIDEALVLGIGLDEQRPQLETVELGAMIGRDAVERQYNPASNQSVTP